jgi:hypothetical protein
VTLQFDELSRKAASGTLSADERAALDETLRQHPERRFDLEWDAALRARLDEKIAAMPALPGWERTEKVLLAERADGDRARESRADGVRSANRRGVLDRFSEWLAASFGVVVNAQAVAVALVLVQAGVIGLLAWQYSTSDDGVMRTATTDAKPRGPLLRVSFRSEVSEADLRRALAAVGGEIVAGPGQLGVYLVRIKDGSLGAAAQKLRETGTTELVEVVKEP